MPTAPADELAPMEHRFPSEVNSLRTLLRESISRLGQASGQ